MIFDEYQEPLQVWRMVTPTGAWVDPVWTSVSGITGRIEPVSGTESFLQNQSFADVTETCLAPYEYRNYIHPKDGIVDSDGIQREVVGEIELWKNIHPHIAFKLKRAQWAVV